MNNQADIDLKTAGRPFLVVLVFAIVLNMAGICIRFISDDPALYAIIARNMVKAGNFTDLTYRGLDWLDKPHFPFWVAALSFKCFGINTFAYKLPALVFFFLSVFFTYRLTRKLYDLETALIAILILLTAQHVVMSNTDVRAEPYIMGLLMGAVYHFYGLKERLNFWNLFWGALFTACAVMTKGIYLLIPIGAAIIGDYLFKKDIKNLFRWRWLLAFVLVAIFTLPEIYVLYRQFDVHPEKVVFGRTHVSGIQWFLWGSQFGRFNDNGFIHSRHTDPFFFLHTLLWAFLPWAILLYYSIFKSIRDMVKGIAQPEYLAISGGMIMLLIFSISKFQLPFYTNILFPFFAMITAVFIRSIKPGGELVFFKISQYIICGLLLVALVVLHFFFAPGYSLRFIILIVIFSLLAIYIYKRKDSVYRPLFLLTCCVSILVNAYLVVVVYPTMEKYKGDIAAADFLNKNYPTEPFVATKYTDYFDFYLNRPATYVPMDLLLKSNHPKGELIFANDIGLNKLKASGTAFSIIKSFENNPAEAIVPAFLVESKRASALDHFYLIRLN